MKQKKQAIKDKTNDDSLKHSKLEQNKTINKEKTKKEKLKITSIDENNGIQNTVNNSLKNNKTMEIGL